MAGPLFGGGVGSTLASRGRSWSVIDASVRAHAAGVLLFY